MQGRLALAVCLIAAVLAGCEARVTDANLREVKPEMTTKEVESILGPPKRIESPPELKSPEVKTLPVSRYVYEQDGRTVTLTFVGDRLADGGVIGSFSKASPARPK